MLGLIVYFLAGSLKVSHELMEGVHDSLHVSPAVIPLHVCVESKIIEHLLNTQHTSVSDSDYENVSRV